MKIICHTLFDITKTDVNFRSRYDTSSSISGDLVKQRNQRSNFETILQIIAMRSQPENITTVTKIDLDVKDLDQYDFGYVYSKKYLKNVKSVAVWTFEFDIDRVAVFDNGISELGYLFEDCQDVPMILNLDETVKLSPHLDVSDESRNIRFVKLN